MSPAELLALSLVASVGVAAVCLGAGAALERVSRDPVLRHRAWGVALILTAVPPLVVGLSLLAPAPIMEFAAPTMLAGAPAPTAAPIPISPAEARWSPTLLAVPFLILALVVAIVRGVIMCQRLIQLQRLVRSAAACTSVQSRVRAESARLSVDAPHVRIAAAAPEPLLTGLLRPVLILPDTTTPDAVLAHELAHLKRGDHRALAWEEALAVVLAINPMIPLIRRRRAAAREEATDALALAGADAPARRAYARTLVAALEARVRPTSLPALTFTGTRRTDAMNRLNAVLTPAARARRTVRLTALGAGVALTALAAGASLAVAQQREGRSIVEEMNRANEDVRWVHAALQPIFLSAWPDACGLATDEVGRPFIHAGEGCRDQTGARPMILRLAGVDPTRDAQTAFEAVSRACASGKGVEIAYDTGGVRGSVMAACSQAPLAPLPPAPVLLAVAVDQGVEVRPGDRLEVRLSHTADDGTRMSKSMAFPVTAEQGLPDLINGSMTEPQLPRLGKRAFAIAASLVRADGGIVAATAPRASVTVGPDGGQGELRLIAAEAGRATAESAARHAVQVASRAAAQAQPSPASFEAQQAARAAARAAVAAAARPEGGVVASRGPALASGPASGVTQFTVRRPDGDAGEAEIFTTPALRGSGADLRSGPDMQLLINGVALADGEGLASRGVTSDRVERVEIDTNSRPATMNFHVSPSS